MDNADNETNDRPLENFAGDPAWELAGDPTWEADDHFVFAHGIDFGESVAHSGSQSDNVFSPIEQTLELSGRE